MTVARAGTNVTITRCGSESALQAIRNQQDIERATVITMRPREASTCTTGIGRTQRRRRGIIKTSVNKFLRFFRGLRKKL
jgi:hypothetical protein